jgi:hypothetical protein
MKRLKDILGLAEFHILMLVVGLLSLSWPLLSVFEEKHPGDLLLYFFLIWIIFIILLFLLGRSIRAPSNADDKDGARGSP